MRNILKEKLFGSSFTALIMIQDELFDNELALNGRQTFTQAYKDPD